MTTIAVLATGGTIATRTNLEGETVASEDGAHLVERLPTTPDFRVTVENVFTLGSYLMTLPLMHQLARRVQAQLDDHRVSGVVVTHGTDTMEETGYFLDLVVDDARPIVLTGAQRAADAHDPDGPRNLSDALTVAAHPAARGLGTVIVFAGAIFAARGTRKSRTLTADSFAAASGGPLGFVHGDIVRIEAQPRRTLRVSVKEMRLEDVRVDVVACYPGADATALHAFVAQGARGIVLEATGAGNANPEICEAVRDLTERGVVVVTSTRVESGPVTPIYGNGGGIDLEAAGAVGSGLLRAPQARVLLAALLATHRDPMTVRAELVKHISG